MACVQRHKSEGKKQSKYGVKQSKNRSVKLTYR